MYEYYQEDGYRQLIAFKCPPYMSKETLKEWLLEHSQKAKYLPGLRWYTLCFTFDKIDYSDGSPGEPLQFDAFEEMYFHSLDALKKAYESNIMQSELAHMAEDKLDYPGLFNGVWAEANVIKMKGLSSPPSQKNCARLFGGCKRAHGMTKRELKDWYYAHAERVLDEDGRMIIPEIIGYIHNFSVDDSPFGEPFVDAYCNNWWSSREDMFKSFNGDIWQAQLKDREGHIDIHDKSLFIGALGIEHIVDLSEL